MYQRQFQRSAAVALGVLCCLANTALAGGWPHIPLPVNSLIKNKTGLQLLIDSDGLESSGYRSLRVEVRTTPLAPLPADRQIRVVIKPRTYNSVKSPAVSQVIDLPEGSTVVKTTIPVPQMNFWYGMAIETYEGGRKLDELSEKNLGWVSGRAGWNWSEEQPAMLFIDSNVPPRADREAAIGPFQTTGADPTPTTRLPDVRMLVWLFGDPNQGTPAGGITGPATGPKPTDVALLSQITSTNHVEILPPAELPHRWIELSQCDCIVVSFDDLRLMSQQYPEALAALSDWVCGGPLLMVYGAGGQFDKLSDIEKLLGLSALPNSENDASEYRAWDQPVAADAGEIKNAWTNQRFRRTTRVVKQRVTYQKGTNVPLEPATPPSPPTQVTTGGPPPFVYRPAGQGCLVAIGAANPFPGKSTDWGWIFNTVDDNHWRWYRRQGFSLQRTNDDYWTFLIPGVGRAPVFPFLFLVTLFAIAIGPVNYYFLNRARRLYLLLITVPVGALFITVALFSYAVVADGLGVRLRSRSFTDLDQRTGRAASWSRQSYYAALVPSQGLVFPEDATVFPIEYEPQRWGNSGTNDSQVTWSDEQYLRSGYMSSRTATQLMVLRVTKTEARLAVTESRRQDQPPQVENQLGAAVRFLLLKDSREDLYSTKRISRGGKATLVPADLQEAQQELKAIESAVEPKVPEGSNTSHENALSFFMPRSRLWMPGATAPSGIDPSLLEAGIRKAAAPTAEPLAARSYIAIVERPPVVPIGVPRVTEEASLHVIHGQY